MTYYSMIWGTMWLQPINVILKRVENDFKRDPDKYATDALFWTLINVPI